MRPLPGARARSSLSCSIPLRRGRSSWGRPPLPEHAVVLRLTGNAKTSPIFLILWPSSRLVDTSKKMPEELL